MCKVMFSVIDHPISDSDTGTDSEDNDNRLTEVRQPDSRGKSG